MAHCNIYSCKVLICLIRWCILSSQVNKILKFLYSKATFILLFSVTWLCDDSLNYFLLQLAYLSQERVSFGNLPLFCRGRRMVFIMNRSRDRPVSFEWHVTNPQDSQVNMSLIMIKPVIEVYDKIQHKLGFMATEDCQRLKI